jgi:hypothetical protein
VLSAIEQALYGNRGTHGIFEFTLAPGYIRLRAAPWEEPKVWVLAVFADARLAYVEEYADDGEDLDLPWDIIGFDSYELPAGCWKFVLHCSAIEWCFESAWPDIERRPAEPS